MIATAVDVQREQAEHIESQAAGDNSGRGARGSQRKIVAEG